jgi:hypothetical protein
MPGTRPGMTAQCYDFHWGCRRGSEAPRGLSRVPQQMEAVMRKHDNFENLPSFQHLA